MCDPRPAQRPKDRSGEEASRPQRRVKPRQRARPDHLVAQAIVFRLAAVAPYDAIGMRERGDLAHPTQQTRVTDEVRRTYGRRERIQGFELIH